MCGNQVQESMSNENVILAKMARGGTFASCDMCTLTLQYWLATLILITAAAHVHSNNQVSLQLLCYICDPSCLIYTNTPIVGILLWFNLRL